MEIKEVIIKLSEETLKALEESARAAGRNPEEIAAEMLTKSLKSPPEKPVKPSFPSVALMRHNEPPPTEAVADQPRQLFPGAIASGKPQISPEKMQRRKELEAQMRELSLLIDTASSEDNRETYSLQYAILAAELEATI